MSAADVFDPFVRRRELEAEIERSQEAEQRHGVQVGDVERELDAAKLEIEAAYEAEARTGREGIAKAARQKVADVESALRIAREARDGAHRARLACRAEWESFLRQYFDVFAEACERKTEAALGLLRDLEGPIGEAWAAWREAEYAWRPLVESAPRGPSSNVYGAAPASTLTYPPNFPLATPAAFRHVAPRPPELTTEQEPVDDLLDSALFDGGVVKLLGEAGTELQFELPLTENLRRQFESGDLRPADEESMTVMSAYIRSGVA